MSGQNESMSRKARDENFAGAFSERLTQVLGQLDVPISQLGRELGYRDGSTLHSAASGRCVLDVERLVKLSEWCRSRNFDLDLHWLLTGETTPVANGNHDDWISGWLTPKRQSALRTLADAVKEMPKSSRQSRWRPRRTD